MKRRRRLKTTKRPRRRRLKKKRGRRRSNRRSPPKKKKKTSSSSSSSSSSAMRRRKVFTYRYRVRCRGARKQQLHPNSEFFIKKGKCALRCSTCRHRGCNARTCFPIQFCPRHLKSDMKLEIKSSMLPYYDTTIPPMLGLFAVHPLRDYLFDGPVGKAGEFKLRNGEKPDRRIRRAIAYKYRVSGKQVKKGNFDIKLAFNETKEKAKLGNKFFTVPVFRTGDLIAEFVGFFYDSNELEEKYPCDALTPYAISTSNKGARDGACQRGVASFANSIFDARKEEREEKKLYTFPRYLPNSETRKIGRNRVGLYAKGNIFDGDEIVTKYGAEYTKIAMAKMFHLTSDEDVPANFVWARGWNLGHN